MPRLASTAWSSCSAPRWLPARCWATCSNAVGSASWAQLCIFTDSFFGEWIYVEGTTEITALPEAMEGLVDYYRRVSGEHDDWDDYREAMRRDRRVLLHIEATRAGPDRKG